MGDGSEFKLNTGLAALYFLALWSDRYSHKRQSNFPAFLALVQRQHVDNADIWSWNWWKWDMKRAIPYQCQDFHRTKQENEAFFIATNHLSYFTFHPKPAWYHKIIQVNAGYFGTVNRSKHAYDPNGPRGNFVGLLLICWHLIFFKLFFALLLQPTAWVFICRIAHCPIDYHLTKNINCCVDCGNSFITPDTRWWWWQRTTVFIL